MMSVAEQRISVVIPNYNDGKHLPTLLDQLSQMSVSEILVVDAGSTDDSLLVSQKYETVKWLACAKGRGQQIHAGILKANGDIIWVLHADTRLPEAAKTEILRILGVGKNVLGCFPTRFSNSQKILKIYSWFTNFDHVLTTFGDQGFFFRRSDYLATDGIRPCPLLEDVVLRRQLLALGRGRVEKAEVKIETSARRFRKRGIIKSQLKNAWILTQYFCGVPASKLYHSYYR